MIIDSHTILNQTNPNRQPQSQTILRSRQKVYLYGDTKFTGTLIRPIERTHPPRWTVQLDRGGYDSAMVSEITPIAPEPVEADPEIPFSDSEPTISELEREVIALRKENAKLRQEKAKLKQENEIRDCSQR